MTPDGTAPYWHQVEDTYDKIGTAALESSYSFTRRFIQSLDEQAH